MPPIESETEEDGEETVVFSLVQHLVEEYPDAPALVRQALAYNDYGDGAVFCSEAAHRVALAFSRVYVEAGRGGSVRKLLQQYISPSLTKVLFLACQVVGFGELRVSALFGPGNDQ